MELRVLRYFLAVAREESITAAAESLHVTQPTLSKQLMDLERELGKTLFVRGNRKITLTEDGELLRQHAREIIELADKTLGAFTDDAADVAGDVHIGCGETQGMRSIIRIIKDLTQSNPRMRFHIYSGNDEDVSERLDKGLLDFGLFVGNAKLDKYDYIKLPASDTWGLLMRKDDPLAACAAIKPDDLDGTPLLCSRQALANNELSGWLGKDFSTLDVRSTHNLLYNASLMVEEGIGCALSIEGLLDTEGRNLTFRPFEPTVKADLTFVWKKHRAFSKPAALFLNRLQADLKQQAQRQ